MNKTIGIMGLGRTGLPVSEAYLKAGYEVYGYDIREEAVIAFELLGGHFQTSPELVAMHCDVVLILVLNDQQVIESLTGRAGILPWQSGPLCPTERVMRNTRHYALFRFA